MSNTDFDPNAYLATPPKEADAGFDPDHYLASTAPQPSLTDKLMQTWPAKAAQSLYSAATLPGDVVAGSGDVAPTKPGMWSDEDEARLQLNNAALADRAESAATFMTPGSVAARAGEGVLGVPVTARTIPKPEAGQFGVSLSAGEKADDLAMRQQEQAAIRSGDPHAQAWIEQRVAQLESAKDRIAAGFDPYMGQTLAENPQEAGALVSRGVQTGAATAKAAVKDAYKQAQAMPGEIHASVLQDMPENIKTELSGAEQPVIIDKGTTPFASQMIDFLDNQAGKLNIPDKADPLGPVPPGGPFGPPQPGDMLGVNLRGVDQIRKNLSQMRSDAFGASPPGKTSGDARAAQAVLNSFDNHIDEAVNGGMFNGDKSAVAAWNNARAANADYQSTFGIRKGDPVSRVVQKIIGDNVNDPLTPSKVMDQLVGASRTNPSALNIGVANKLKTVLGEQSPEWIGAKQGLFKSLVTAGEGEAAFGTGQQAQRLSKFLNSDMAPVVYNPQELQTLRSYANLMRQITMPPGSYFPSAPGIAKVVSVVANRVGAVVGALIGRAILPGMPLVGELGGLTVGSQAEKAIARAHNGVSKQLPLVGQQMAAWSKAQAAAQETGNPMLGRAAAVATVNLQKALSPLGINLNQIAAQGTGPSPVNAAQDQQNVPGPVNQQQTGGRVGQKNGFAHGGAIKGESGGKVKVTKVKAHYRGGVEGKRCGLCTMFRVPHGCTAVRGVISPRGVCDLYEPVKETGSREGVSLRDRNRSTIRRAEGGDVGETPDPALPLQQIPVAGVRPPLQIDPAQNQFLQGHGASAISPYSISLKNRLDQAKQRYEEDRGAAMDNYDVQAQREWLGTQPPSDGNLTLYRATPNGDSIRPGDYVTNSRAYAQQHIDANLGGEGKITSVKAHLGEIHPADGPKEFWYYPHDAGAYGDVFP